MPTTENGTVPPRRRTNLETRPREYLTPKEVDLLITTARKRGRHSHRDATMILMAYHHMLRVIELCRLRWEQVDFDGGQLQVRRVKGSKSGVHPLWGADLRALRKLKRDQHPSSPYVFTTERKTPVTDAGFRKTLARIGEEAEFPWRVHPHMLRHAGGYKFANDNKNLRAISEFAGNKNIQNTILYTELATDRYLSFWED